MPADARILVAYSDGPASPRLAPAEALAAAGVPGEPTVLLGLTVDRLAWLDDPDLRGATFLPGYALARAVDDGRLTPLSIRFSSVPSMLAERPPQVGVIAVVRRHDGFAFAGSVGWADVLARTAGRLVLEVDEQGRDLGGPLVDDLAGDRVAAVVARPQHDVAAATQRQADAIDLGIGATVAGLVPDGATLQFGPGAIGEGIATALHKPVRIRSGMLTDAMAALHERGLLAAPAVAAYTWGGEPIRALAEAGMLRLTSITETNDPGMISQVPRFVACNTALQVGLDGSVNIERVGGRVITGIGGHADFCAGASCSVGGLSIIAVRSTAADGSPTIVDQVEMVSTPRCDIDIVITEHGVADLRGATDAARRSRLLAISGR